MRVVAAVALLVALASTASAGWRWGFSPVPALPLGVHGPNRPGSVDTIYIEPDSVAGDSAYFDGSISLIVDGVWVSRADSLMFVWTVPLWDSTKTAGAKRSFVFVEDYATGAPLMIGPESYGVLDFGMATERQVDLMVHPPPVEEDDEP